MKNQLLSSISLKQSEIGSALQQQGWWAGSLLSNELVAALLIDASKLYEQDQFSTAAVGAQHSKIVNTSIRGDHTYWVEGETTAQTQFMQVMTELKNTFESHFPIPLNDFDGHYSYYPAGTFYRKHMDNARSNNNRIFSVVSYFNKDWQVEDGGELVLFYPETDAEVVRIQPTFGTTAIFFSTDFPHEVTKTLQPRYSLTGWMTHKKAF
jgi:SM-20-related protein